MPLLLEGPNLVGKSVLAERYAASGWQIFTAPPRQRTEANLLSVAVRQARTPRAVTSRWWVTDEVYACITASGRKPLLSLAAKWIVGMVARRFGAVLALLEVPDEVLEKRCRTHPIRLEARDMTPRLVLEVAAQYRNPDSPWLKYCPFTIRLDPRDLSAMLKLEANAIAQEDNVSALQCASLGTMTPGQVLLVGEQAHSSAQEPLPFMDLTAASAALWFLCERAGLTPATVHVANALARHSDKPLPLQHLVEFIQPRVVVAMDNVAAGVLSDLGIPYRRFPHPPWTGRFERDLLETWGDHLRDTCA